MSRHLSFRTLLPSRFPVLRATLVAAAPLALAAGLGAAAPASSGPAPLPPASRTLQVFATSDEHGWLDPLVSKSAGTYQGGMAFLYGQLQNKEMFRAKQALLLSGGDMWTGPYESTVLQGRPMVQVMNTMGYAAAGVGNHDFDFGQEILAKRAGEAAFPLLAANLWQRSPRVHPPWVKPYTVVDMAGIKVGVVGLLTLETPFTTDRRNLVGLDIEPFGDALQRVIPKVRAEGAQVIVVLAHAESREVRPFTPWLRAMGIHAVICGHHHMSSLEVDQGDVATSGDDVIFCNPGAYARSYCKLELILDAQTLALQSHRESVEVVAGKLAKPTYGPHDGLLGLVAESHAQAEARGSEVLADIPEGLHREAPVPSLGYLTVDSWLQAVPTADFAVTNSGGFRQDVEGGSVKMRDLVGAMPFDNYLVVVRMTGAQLVEVLENAQSIPGGMVAEVKEDALGKRTVVRLLDRTGTPLDPRRSYRVVVNDFMYRGGDRYRLKEFDAAPEETGLHWREPLARMLRDATKDKRPLVLPTEPRFRVVP